MVTKYIPKQGDIAFLDFNSTKEHEQSGHRPCIIISNNTFNKNTKMVIVCPISSNEKEFPTHYILKNTKKIHGSVLCEHIRSIDYEIRNLKFIETCNNEDINNVIMLINSCIEE